jgi:hypothetical protein
MSRSARLRVLAVGCVLAASVTVLVATRASATVRGVEAGCQRSVTVAVHSGHHHRDPDSWRGKMLRTAGCGAWRTVHDRMRHGHRRLHRVGTVPAHHAGTVRAHHAGTVPAPQVGTVPVDAASPVPPARG